MIEVILWLVAIIVFPILYILFSDLKPYNWQEELNQNANLCKSIGLRDEYPSEEKVFKTLKDAGIKPCFLDVGLDKEDKE